MEQQPTPDSKPKKQIQLNFFETACTSSVNAIGQWKNPLDISRTKDTLAYYVWLAQIAERGLITSIFFTDLYGGAEVYDSSKNTPFSAGSQVGRLDPVTVVSAMAVVSENVGFGVTGSISYIPPYLLARTWSSLDHLTRGRIDLLSHSERYVAAEEYMDIVYSLWEKSWEDGAQKWQVEPEMAYDPSKIHKIDYKGEYFSISAAHQTHPTPQRTPLLFQAGASKDGIGFGGKHAEAIFCAHSTIAATKAYTSSVRAAAAAQGRDPSSIKFFLGTMVFLGRTVEEAQEKFERAKKYCSIEGGLARFSDFANFDMSVYTKDEPFIFGTEPRENAIHGAIEGMKVVSEAKEITPRDVGEMLALGGLGPRPVGTAEMVADELLIWAEGGDIDGFNLQSVVLPQSWDDVVELLVPELQRRGVYWSEYPVPGGTLRENMNAQAGYSHLSDDHPGSKFKWNAKAEAAGGE